MLARIVRWFWPDLSELEVKKYGLLSFAFFFIIGAYWLERPLKDGIFFPVVGKAWQPTAKIMSVFVVSIMVMVYSKLIDMFEKHRMFYILGTFYAVLFSIIGYCIWLMPNLSSPAEYSPFFKFIGWASYFIIESFGSVIVALFWSFTSSVSDAGTAKKCYPFVIAGAQIGSIIGPTLALFAKQLGLGLLFAIVVMAILALMFVIKKFMAVIPEDQITISKKEADSEKKKTGFMEGLKLLLTRPYLFGIFMVVTIYEVVGTIVDYQMKVQAEAFYPTKEALTSFLGIFGIAVNGLAFVMALLGTSYLMKRFGLRFCLLTFPITLGVAVAILYGVYVGEFVSPWALLWVTFGVMMLAKGLSYALNNPSKEMMYIPTSKDAKFKSKGWIDMFGSRGSKALGGVFTNQFAGEVPTLMAFGTILSLGLIGVWIVAAVFVSSKFAQLTKENKIVE
ncbi:TPA: hypothetical protein DEO28_01490 [Candidatus Dependentiae bacterium]|nr:MAG: hypothetical protein UR14_C0003G0145 [candidate division TM6 bacterium GW2011_GWE2_31_21]KKP53691.1 MAG: hypothetical protein UR43_C0003G0012 [candidate division TM6 bacterium GW2011_GWF2_33_332]HBS48557.1 hypothetical protein [Candidatus Dependentiae bacterium]HBZ73172.1 hypothetical protein [Candidatus Dependentiae bacterium]